MQNSTLRRLAGATLVIAGVCGASPLVAQTDYYNTDRSRPVRVEDAHPTDLYALEIKLAPVRLDRLEAGLYRWEIDSEIAWGILPGTSVELGLPIVVQEQANGGKAGVALGGLALSAFHNLNNETQGFPALAVRGDVLLPVGGAAPSGGRYSVTGIATRTYPIARVHANVLVTAGGESESEPADHARLQHGPPRWLAGVAVDRAFPLSALLLTASVHAARPIGSDDREWVAGAGGRYQLNPYLGVDFGIGRRFATEPGWFLTFGSAFHIGVRSFIPSSSRTPANP